MLEKRHTIRFLVKEGIRALDNPGRLRNVSHEAVMKKIQIFFWVGKVRRGREDLSDEERLGRPPVADFDEIIAFRLERDPRTTF
jgi:hypothetical protein